MHTIAQRTISAMLFSTTMRDVRLERHPDVARRGATRVRKVIKDGIKAALNRKLKQVMGQIDA